MGIVVVGRRQRIKERPGVAAVGPGGLGVDDRAVLGQLDRPAGDGHAVGGSGRVGVHVLELAGLDVDLLRVDEGSGAGAAGSGRRARVVDGCPGEPVGRDDLMDIVVVRRRQEERGRPTCSSRRRRWSWCPAPRRSWSTRRSSRRQARGRRKWPGWYPRPRTCRLLR